MRAPDTGFTLVEVLIALVLFAMIGLAGSSLLNAMIGVEARTDGRLARLGELERAMHVISLDFEQQIAGRPILVEGSKAVVSRYAGSEASGSIDVEYDVQNHELYRMLGRAGGEPQRQSLLSQVDALRWQFFAPSVGWVDTWPPSPGIGATTAARPQAIAAVITLSGGQASSGGGAGLSGSLRRVVRLPETTAP